jgi:hypothetical protein
MIHAIGDVIVLRDAMIGRDGRDIRTFKVEEDVLGQMAWVNMTAHFMYVYLDTVAVASGLGDGLA